MKVTYKNLNKLENVQPYKQPNKIPLSEIGKQLNDVEKKLTDEQLEKIQDFAYLLGELIYKNWVQKQNTINNIQDEESNIIYKGEYRRAS